jgi:hypothetical protein
MQNKSVYLDQREVATTEGIKGSSDCGNASWCSMASFFDPSYGTLQAVADMVADLEPYKGPRGFGNFLVDSLPWAKAISLKGGRIGSDLRAYVEYSKAKFPNLKITHGNPGSFAELDEILLQKYPVMLYTNLAGDPKKGTGGHYIPVWEKVGSGYKVGDPYGNALTHYKDHNGNGIIYPSDFLKSKIAGRPYYLAMR